MEETEAPEHVVHLRVTPSLRDRLQREAARSRRSMAWVARELLDEALTRREEMRDAPTDE
jgi:predicted transcriptional regulator